MGALAGTVLVQELVDVLKRWPTPSHCPEAFKIVIADLVVNMFREKKQGARLLVVSTCSTR